MTILLHKAVRKLTYYLLAFGRKELVHGQIFTKIPTNRRMSLQSRDNKVGPLVDGFYQAILSSRNVYLLS